MSLIDDLYKRCDELADRIPDTPTGKFISFLIVMTPILIFIFMVFLFIIS